MKIIFECYINKGVFVTLIVNNMILTEINQ